jgi:hypothetical protein
MPDILEPIAQPATFRRLRWREVNIDNPEGTKGLRALAEWIPVTADNCRVPGAAERDASRDVVIEFDPANPKHFQVYVLLDEICREADAARVVP